MKKLSVHHVHHVPKYMSCHKALAVITSRGHCFHENLSVHLASVRFEHFVCHGSLMTTYGYTWFL